MDFSKIQITQETFFKVGIVCFFVIGCANIANYFYNLSIQNPFTTISSWAIIIFNFALSGFFYFLYKQLTPDITEEYQSEEIEDIIKQVKEGGDRGGKSTRIKKKIKKSKGKA